MTHLVFNQFRSPSKWACCCCSCCCCCCCCCLCLHQDMAVHGGRGSEKSRDGNAPKTLRLWVLIMSVGPPIAQCNFNKWAGCRNMAHRGRVVFVLWEIMFCLSCLLHFWIREDKQSISQLFYVMQNYVDSFEHIISCDSTQRMETNVWKHNRTPICMDREKEKKERKINPVIMKLLIKPLKHSLWESKRHPPSGFA